MRRAVPAFPDPFGPLAAPARVIPPRPKCGAAKFPKGTDGEVSPPDPRPRETPAEDSPPPPATPSRSVQGLTTEQSLRQARNMLAASYHLLQRTPPSLNPHAAVFLRQALLQIGGAEIALDNAIALNRRPAKEPAP